MVTTNDSTHGMNNIIRFPGTTFETPASTDRKTKRTKPSPALSPDEVALLAAFNRLSEYGRRVAALDLSFWADLEALEVQRGKPADNAWHGIRRY